MNNKKIFQNMTKGEWETPSDIFPSDSLISINAHGNIAHIMTKDYGLTISTANAHAITSAVNNTYGKGINPESVPVWEQTLLSLHEKITHRINSLESAWHGFGEGDMLFRASKKRDEKEIEFLNEWRK